MFEILDHTADIGLHIRAATLENLFEHAAEGLFSLILEDLAAVREQTLLTFEIAAAGELAAPDPEAAKLPSTVPAGRVQLPGTWEDLLHDWLTELLILFDRRRIVCRRFEVRFTTSGLAGRAWGEDLSLDRHRPRMEIKAVTYHQLRIDATPQGFEAWVIFDL